MEQQSQQQPVSAPPPPGPRASERVWRIPCFFQTQTGEVVRDDQGVATAMLEIQGILLRLGGVVSIGSKRVPVSAEVPGIYETTELIVRWQSFVPVAAAPPADKPAPAPAAQDEPEPAPLEEEDAAGSEAEPEAG